MQFILLALELKLDTSPILSQEGFSVACLEKNLVQVWVSITPKLLCWAASSKFILKAWFLFYHVHHTSAGKSWWELIYVFFCDVLPTHRKIVRSYPSVPYTPYIQQKTFFSFDIDKTEWWLCRKFIPA
jgi:hypothetical protein